MKASSRILIVDDEEQNLDLLSRRLSRAGYEVETANNGRRALEIVARGAVDLVLLDQMMPEMSGLEVLHQLRASPVTEHLPVIMVTALTDSARVAEALDLGANDYVTKPLDFQVALARIRAQVARRQADSELRENEERYELAMQGAGKILVDWDLVADTVYHSPDWFRLIGYEPEDASRWHEKRYARIHPADLPRLLEALESDSEARSTASIQSGLMEVPESTQVEYRLRHRDGHYLWVALQSIVLRDKEGRAIRRIGSLQDITAIKTVDALTGLGNGLAFADRVDAAIQKRQQDLPVESGAGAPFAVLLYEIDHFRMIEDYLGHAQCDAFLRMVAQRAQLALVEYASAAGVTNASYLKLARLGKEQFGLVIDPVFHAAEAEAIAERLAHAMRPAFSVAEREMICSIRLGIALYQPEYREAEAMIRDAGSAVYVAKTQGASPWRLFDPSQRRLRENRMQLEIDLRLALQRREFETYYQSRVELDTGRICGFEALIRWNHPARGVVSPAEFIPMAEEAGLIHEIGLWIMRQACAQLVQWREKYALPDDFEISVNLSASQCREPRLVEEVAAILQETGLPARNLNLELTESLLFEDLKEAKKVLESLKNLGVGLKIDDFGTGYSSLKYLCELPFDCLKIDRSFTYDLDKNNPDTDEMVRTILQMARNLQMEVIAEGVENREHVVRLKEMGCEFGQGYFFSRPVSAAQAEAKLQENLAGAGDGAKQQKNNEESR
jgi:diguanylate cyclase (GGDEF)-like protein